MANTGLAEALFDLATVKKVKGGGGGEGISLGHALLPQEAGMTW